MPKTKQTPIRRSPINNRGILYITPVPRLDRIQLSVQNTGDNYSLIKWLFKKKADSFFCRPLSGDRNGEYCKLYWNNRKITLRTEWGYYFAINLSQPDEAIQRFAKDIILKGAKNGIRSLTQVEFALDYYSSNRKQLKRIERYLSRHVVMKNLRANGTCRYDRKGTNTTYYQGKGGDVRKGDKGITIYAKDGRNFCRVELKAHQPLLKRQGLTFESLPIAPDAIRVIDYITFRDVPSQNTTRLLARQFAEQRMKKVKKFTKRRREAMRRTMQALFLDSMQQAQIDEKTVAEMVDLLKRKQRKVREFSFTMDRAFPRIPLRNAGKAKIQILPNYLGIEK